MARADDEALHDENMRGNAITVHVLQEGREITVPRGGEQPLAWSRYPRAQPPDRPGRDTHRQHRDEPVYMIGVENLFKRLHDTGNKTDILLGNHYGDG